MFNTVSFERLLEVTDRDLTVINDDLVAVYGDATLTEDEKRVLICNAYNTINEWSAYYHRFKEIQDSKIYELVSENQILKEQIRQLETLLEAKDTNSNMVQVDLVAMIESLDKVVDLIDENAKALTLSRKLKTEPNVNKHGAEHPRYKDNIDNDELIKDYKSGRILKELSEKYKLSIPGIRNRLIDLGVYQNKYKTDK